MVISYSQYGYHPNDCVEITIFAGQNQQEKLNPA